MSAILEYDYPGNIRELKSILQTSVNLAQGTIITVSDLPRSFLRKKPKKHHKLFERHEYIVPLAELEKGYIVKTYEYEYMGR